MLEDPNTSVIWGNRKRAELCRMVDYIILCSNVLFDNTFCTYLSSEFYLGLFEY